MGEWAKKERREEGERVNQRVENEGGGKKERRKGGGGNRDQREGTGEREGRRLIKRGKGLTDKKDRYMDR